MNTLPVINAEVRVLYKDRSITDYLSCVLIYLYLYLIKTNLLMIVLESISLLF